MKRLALAAALVLSCAAQKPSPPVVAQASLHWNPQIRANVLLSCQAQLGPGKLCDCLTEKLEVISPDPDVELTHQDVTAALAACHSVQMTTSEPL